MNPLAVALVASLLSLSLPGSDAFYEKVVELEAQRLMIETYGRIRADFHVCPFISPSPEEGVREFHVQVQHEFRQPRHLPAERVCGGSVREHWMWTCEGASGFPTVSRWGSFPEDASSGSGGTGSEVLLGTHLFTVLLSW